MPKLIRRDWMLLATANDCCLDTQGHRIRVAMHPPVWIRPADSILSPLGEGRLPMVFVFDRPHLLVVEVQLVPQKASRDFPFNIPVAANVLEVKHRRHIPQQGQIWVAGLFRDICKVLHFGSDEAKNLGVGGVRVLR